MGKISALNYFDNGSFSTFSWVKRPEYTVSPYYYDEDRAKKEKLKESIILDNDLKTNSIIMAHKIANTLTVYPVKGFKGDKNSNFYEYLTMGIFPYITGGLTFISLFNGITKYLKPEKAKEAKKYGFSMALGVIFYAAAKAISNKIVTKTLNLKTGIDMDLPCRNVVDLIATTPEEYEANEERLKKLKEAGLPDKKSFEYHKVYESVDFPRFDLLYKTPEGFPRNYNFDVIAAKNGFGTNLKDSGQEVKPFIKEVVSKARTTQNISQYLWAAVGVGLGVQDKWQKLLDLGKLKKGDKSYYSYTKELLRNIKDITKDACKEFYNGGAEGCRKLSSKIAGRTILWLAVLTTVLGTINAMRNPYIANTKDMESNSVFKTNKKVEED